jgi:prepilin-type N-terminal cleavage/methylation domain-containing protein
MKQRKSLPDLSQTLGLAETARVQAWMPATRRQASQRAGFTLVELLLVIAIIAILAGLSLVTLAEGRQMARRNRTATQVTRIHETLMVRYEDFEARIIPLPATANLEPQLATTIRYNLLMDLMRMEFPDRISDVFNPPSIFTIGASTYSVPNPSLRTRYQTIVASNGGFGAWSTDNEGSECLHMILSSMETILGNGLDALSPTEIGDTDGDGFLEILDSWGNPIEFIRWAPGYESPIQWHPVGFAVNPPNVREPDPFDPFRRGRRWIDLATYPNNFERPFAITPLIVSAGTDGRYGLHGLRDPGETAGFPNDKPNFAAGDPDAADPYFYFSSLSGVYYDNFPYSFDNSGTYIAQLGAEKQFLNNFSPAGDNIDNHSSVAP